MPIKVRRFSPENQPVVEALLALGEELKQKIPPPTKEALEAGRQRLLEEAARRRGFPPDSSKRES